jgi:hypothetical protein
MNNEFVVTCECLNNVFLQEKRPHLFSVLYNLFYLYNEWKPWNLNSTFNYL